MTATSANQNTKLMKKYILISVLVVLAAVALMSRSWSNGTVDRAFQINPAFRTPNEEVINRVQPMLEQRFFSNGNPQDYERHRVVEIDTANLRKQVENAQANTENHSALFTISIPLFDDYIIEIGITSLIPATNGGLSAFGHVAGDGALTDSVELHFSQYGQFEGSFVHGADSFVISDVGDYQYYIVAQLETSFYVD